METKRIIILYTDGGARGNPGPAAIGVYLVDQAGSKIVGFGNKIGEATNNVAEYKAVIAGLEWIASNKDLFSTIEEIRVCVDSQLLYSQVVGIYKVKNNNLKELLFSLRIAEASIGIPVRYFNIRREKNKEADAYVNMALDNKL